MTRTGSFLSCIKDICAIFLAITALSAVSGCQEEGCLQGDDPDCTVPSPCEGLFFTCEDGFAEVRVIQEEDEIPGGMGALGSPGDFLLSNSKITAIIDGLDHPHYLSPSGGGLLDLSTNGDDNDSMRHLFQVAGLLPGDAAHYTSVKLIHEGSVQGVQFHGTLDGFEDVWIATRYEIRPCEPGLRVRTELVTLHPDPQSWTLSDGFYYGGREHLPFSPTKGAGFEHPSVGLSTVADAYREFPYMVAGAHEAPSATYTSIRCDESLLSGFHSEDVSSVGTPIQIYMPGDTQIFERFIGVANAPSISTGVDIALEVRSQLFGEAYVKLRGSLATDDASPIPQDMMASVTISEGEAGQEKEDLVPWTQVFPDENGTFEVSVPSNKDYVLNVELFGREILQRNTTVLDQDVDLDPLVIPSVGEVVVNGRLDGSRHEVLVFAYPADEDTEQDVFGRFLGQFYGCTPLLGNPYGGSPACNRFLVNGPTAVLIPEGTYDFFASIGPFSTLASETDIVIEPGSRQYLTLSMQTLDLQPEGTLSADLHVHGSASFDSQLPDQDRVRSFLAAGIDVVASTEHDVVSNFNEALEAANATDDIVVMEGMEATGHILFRLIPEAEFPQVIGHWNIWPIPHDPHGPWRGAPWDELAEPGELFDRAVEHGWPHESGVVQLNHPIEQMDFGRDVGWANALGLDLNLPLKDTDDGTLQSLFLRTPPGASFSNGDYHAQEVMNGSDNWRFQQYRAFWFYLLNEGVLRAGTANSDSHSLGGNILGTPRNLVYTDTSVEDFDPVEFNLSVRNGEIIGTNGPVILAEISGATDEWHTPSIIPFTPDSDASLHIQVHAAPWVPVDEIRIIVNGEVVRRFSGKDLVTPKDPFGNEDLIRFNQDLLLSELVSEEDSWIVVEAGHALEPTADLDCNGIPDTGDNNGDGVIDWQDVEGLEEDPGPVCLDTTGPLSSPDPPVDHDSPFAIFQRVVPWGYPLAFTNPFVLDVDGNGFTGVAQ